jgi:hypothetical protein
LRKCNALPFAIGRMTFDSIIFTITGRKKNAPSKADSAKAGRDAGVVCCHTAPGVCPMRVYV